MPWNKVDTRKSWKKVDVSIGTKYISKQPLATLCKCKGKYNKIYFNDAAVGLAMELGLEKELLDAYRSGAEFAFKKGERFILSERAGKTCNFGCITGEALCDLIWTATKCTRFRVSKQEDEYMVLTPAYDLEKEGLANGKDD